MMPKLRPHLKAPVSCRVIDGRRPLLPPLPTGKSRPRSGVVDVASITRYSSVIQSARSLNLAYVGRSVVSGVLVGRRKRLSCNKIKEREGPRVRASFRAPLHALLREASDNDRRPSWVTPSSTRP